LVVILYTLGIVPDLEKVIWQIIVNFLLKIYVNNGKIYQKHKRQFFFSFFGVNFYSLNEKFKFKKNNYRFLRKNSNFT